jgi:phosphatidylglycerophosphatase A
MPRWLTKTLATGLGSGLSPIVPGSTGTVPAWLIAYFLLGRQPWYAMVIAAVVMTFLSVWLASEGEKIYGHDAKPIVVDEWAGMFVTLILVPFGFWNYVIGFVTFRLLDAIKIPPAAQAENFPRGWGITADDIVAGIQACLVTHGVVYLLGKVL